MSKQSRQAVADNLWIVAAMLAVVAALSLTSALSLLSQADRISLFGVSIFVPNIVLATVVTFILSFFTHYYDVASGVVAIALVAAMGYVLSEIESEFDSAKANKLTAHKEEPKETTAPTTPEAIDKPDQVEAEK